MYARAMQYGIPVIPRMDLWNRGATSVAAIAKAGNSASDASVSAHADGSAAKMWGNRRMN